jgi:pimeloyl-ACP methyl ester carboxylesterase
MLRVRGKLGPMEREMFVREIGSGPPVLMLHGTPSPAADLMPIAEHLAARYRVLVPDLPGYGKSPPPPDAAYEKVDAAIADMLAARDARRLRGIIGFSTGGYRALEMVLRKRVEADVIIALGAFATLDDAGRDMRRQVARVLEANPQFLYGPEMREMFRQLMLSPAWSEAHPADLARVYEWVHLTSPAALSAELDAMAEMPDLRPELPGLSTRVYLRVGEIDLGPMPAASEEIQRLVPRASLDIVRGCGHTLLIEDLAGTIESVERELGR